MTIAVALKVRDGIVLASDSATTLSGAGQISNIYNHANKVVNLCKGQPIGFMTWGLGGFGNASIATLAKDFRAEQRGTLFADGYEVEAVARAMKEFLEPMSTEVLASLSPEQRGFGFLVAGHTQTQPLGEAWTVEVNPETAEWSEPVAVLPGDVGLVWYGQPQWIQRLVLGIDIFGVAAALVDELGLPPEQLAPAITAIRNRTEVSFVHPAMPVQDAINLGRYLVELTKGATEFSPGALTVGGPTEIAAITKHEGFKWVQRKHYYQAEFNPPVPEG